MALCRQGIRSREIRSEEKLDRLLEALRLTPSSFGLQPWHFVVLSDRERREALVEHSWGQRQPADSSHLIVLCRPAEFGEDDVERFLLSTAESRGAERSTLDAYGGLMTGFLSRLDSAALRTWMENQIYIALGNLLTACAVEQIDACPMEGFPPPNMTASSDWTPWGCARSSFVRSDTGVTVTSMPKPPRSAIPRIPWSLVCELSTRQKGLLSGHRSAGRIPAPVPPGCRYPPIYRRLLNFRDAFPLTDLEGNDTLWKSVLYEPDELGELNAELANIYSRLKTGTAMWPNTWESSGLTTVPSGTPSRSGSGS